MGGSAFLPPEVSRPVSTAPGRVGPGQGQAALSSIPCDVKGPGEAQECPGSTHTIPQSC